MSDTPRYTRMQMERYLLGELPQEQLARMRETESQDAQLKTELDLLRKNNQEVLEKFPPDWMGRKIALEARRGESLPGGAQVPDWQGAAPSFWKIAAPALLALLVVAFLPAGLHFGGAEKAAQAERSKGISPTLEVWRKAEGGPERLASGSLARSGDVLQVRYSVPRELWGAILSIDGAGELTVHLAGAGGEAALLAGGVHTLERSWQLDNAPRFERFYLVTSAERFRVAGVAQAIREGKTPQAESVTVVELKKIP
jgi:hypothetical protein